MASIEKLSIKTGTRYRVRYRDLNKEQRQRTVKTRAEAERFARNVETDKDRGTFVDARAGRTIVADYLPALLDGRPDLRQSTMSIYSSHMRNHIVPRFGAQSLAAIKRSAIRSWISDMQAQGLSSYTIKAIYTLFASLLNTAVDDGLILHNPARGIELPKVERGPMRILDYDEITLLTEATDPHYQLMIQLGAYAGMRFGEVAALRVGNLNLLRRSLQVSETLNEVGSDLIFGPPKTSTSRRSIALPTFVCENLSRHLTNYGHGDGQLVFTSPEGQPIRRRNWQKRIWYPAVDGSVGRPCTFHDLRHSAASLLIREGLSPKVIQERLGHASIKTTLDTYGHLFEGMDRAAADALDAAACGLFVGLGGFRTG